MGANTPEISKKLSEKFPFVAKYFLQLIETSVQKFPQSVVFEGGDPYAQCFFALELARILNCENGASIDCECLNCRWIKSANHPAVNFVSQLHFKPANDDTKTMISVAQTKEIEKTLRETSDYHRFFIFFDAKSAPMDKTQTESYEKFSPEGYNICPDGDWSINHLSQKTFNQAALNVLLKSVEEPPKRTTFVFLVRNRADLLNTIVSRSLVFKMPYLPAKNDVSYIEELFPTCGISYENAFDISAAIVDYIKENQLTATIILDDYLQYLTQIYKTNANPKIFEIIQYVNEAKKWAGATMYDKTVFDTLLLKIARGLL